MKNIIFSFFFLSAFLFSSAALADIIAPNSHLLERCVKLVNLDKFPDLVFVGYITGPMIKGHETYLIENGVCLTKGYKFNRLTILAAKKSYVDSVGIENIVVEKVQIPGECPGGCFQDELADKNVYLVNEGINPGGGSVNENNPLVKEEVEYIVNEISDGKFNLTKFKQVSEYNNGQPKKIETFNNNDEPEPNISVPVPLPKTEKNNFWQSVICFFKRLFGGSCQ